MQMKRKPFTPDELATSLGCPRSFDSGPAPADYWPRVWRMAQYDVARRRYAGILFDGAPEASRLVAAVALSVLVALVLS